MPATYAHHRFGERLFPMLQEPFRTAAQSYRSLYDVGQHGPDILFYYRALKRSAGWGAKRTGRRGAFFLRRQRQQCARHKTNRRRWPTGQG